MKPSKAKKLKVVKLSLYTGMFSFISFLLFSFIFYISTPQVRSFVNFLNEGAAFEWLLMQFDSFYSVFLNLVLLAVSVTSSTVAFMCASLAKACHDQATKVVSESIVS